ncbi:Asp23/Gls24 family envelope stress response protein, partial [Streptomyces niveus]|uniref:Asp23/Gls24 family envelope stress response protein n=1 Tax=Streptomyces niveus TaxID=193462 RepID=UPI0034341239
AAGGTVVFVDHDPRRLAGAADDVYALAGNALVRDVRENVISAVERMTGLEVVEVNIAVSDVKLPDEEDDESESRLQ